MINITDDGEDDDVFASAQEWNFTRLHSRNPWVALLRSRQCVTKNTLEALGQYP